MMPLETQSWYWICLLTYFNDLWNLFNPYTLEYTRWLKSPDPDQNGSRDNTHEKSPRRGRKARSSWDGHASVRLGECYRSKQEKQWQDKKLPWSTATEQGFEAKSLPHLNDWKSPSRFSYDIVFTNVDINNGHWQLKLDFPIAIIFSSPFGHCKWTRKPLGISPAR